jgi:hypothetical protein
MQKRSHYKVLKTIQSTKFIQFFSTIKSIEWSLLVWENGFVSMKSHVFYAFENILLMIAILALSQNC